jgi:hypothetical protein
MPIELDLENPVFQDGLLKLPKPELRVVFKTLQKIVQLEWMHLHRDAKLNWQMTAIQVNIDGERIYTLRVTSKCRATVQRRGNRIVFLELHPDHDGAY